MGIFQMTPLKLLRPSLNLMIVCVQLLYVNIFFLHLHSNIFQFYLAHYGQNFHSVPNQCFDCLPVIWLTLEHSKVQAFYTMYVISAGYWQLQDLHV